MKRKMGNISFETYPLSKCNLKATENMTVCLLHHLVNRCPICGKPLHVDFVFATKISPSECVKLRGAACHVCNMFYTQRNQLVEWLKIKKYNKGIPAIIDGVPSNIERAYVESQSLSYGQPPQFTSDTTVYVFRDHIMGHSTHMTEEVRVSIKNLNYDSLFYAVYCYDCGKYLMKYEDYEKYLRRFKLFPSQVVFAEQKHNDREFELADESPLFRRGYNVNQQAGLSKEVRREILAYIVDTDPLLNKRKVLDYLESFINRNGRNPRFDVALRKWEEDKEWLLDYSEKPVRVVVVGKVERFRRKKA